MYKLQEHVLLTTISFSDPGFEGGGGESTGMFQLGLIIVLWIVVALLLFIFRYDYVILR
jgi:hypothetical protein